MPSYGWEGSGKMQKDPCSGDQISLQPSLGSPAWTHKTPIQSSHFKGFFLNFLSRVLLVNQENQSKQPLAVQKKRKKYTFTN
jgi:hypothetical protein